MSLQIQTTETSQFCVMREGSLDLEWLEAYEQATRTAALAELGQIAVQKARTAPRALFAATAIAAIWFVEHATH